MSRGCNTSVWSMAALCSLAVSDSLSTSMCCLQSEFWLLRVSSLVCKARSSDSFFESSCFSWSICNGEKKKVTSLISFPTRSSTWSLKGVNDHGVTTQTVVNSGRELRSGLFTLNFNWISCNLVYPVLRTIVLLLQKLKGNWEIIRDNLAYKFTMDLA